MMHSEGVIIATAARSAVAKADDEEGARALLREAVTSNKALRAALLNRGIQVAIGEVRRWRRSCILHPAALEKIAEGQKQANERIRRRLGASVRDSILDFPMMNGKPLRLATRAEVESDAAHYTAQGRDMVRKGRWLTMVAQAVPDGKLVGDALNADRINKLLETSRHE